jgi:hypothetical protein
MKFWQIESWLVGHKLIVAVALGLFVILVLWLSGINLINKASNWFYDRGTVEANEEIQKKLDEGERAKQLAAEAIKALAAEKEVTAGLKAEREQREKILADKTLTTNEKLKQFEAAMAREPTVSGPASVDELCVRARAAGVSCD